MAGPREMVGDNRHTGQSCLDKGIVRVYRRLDHGFSLGRVRHAAGNAENHGAEHEERPLGEARRHRHVARCMIFLTNRCSRPSAPLQGVGGDGGQGGGSGREPNSRRACAVVGIADATAHARAHGDRRGQAAHHTPRPDS